MKKRSSYKPRPVIANPMGYVMESVTPIRTDKNKILHLRIKNSAALVNLMTGRANQADIDIIVAMSNLTEALIDFGFGKQHREIAIQGREAILKIVFRAIEQLKFVPTGIETQALNRLMELHDAQLEVINLGNLEKAIRYVNRKIRSQDGITLPKFDVSETQIHSQSKVA